MKRADRRSNLADELAARRDLVARLEQERADLQIEIAAFRQVYLRRVGPARAELDALDLHITEYKLRNELIRLRGSALDPAKLEAEVEWQLRDRRQQFAGYRESIRRAEATVSTDLSSADQLTLKSIYRDLAKRVHPDLAIDAADRDARGKLMAEINAAYGRSDLQALRAMLSRLSEPGGAEGMLSDDRLQAEIDRLEQVIVVMRNDIAELNRSDWMVMKLDAAIARSKGIDWFDRAHRWVDQEAAKRRVELDGLIAEFRDLLQRAGIV